MKKLFQLLALAVILSLTSCNKDNSNPMDTADSMLKSVTVTKTADGSFNVSHEVAPNIASEYIEGDEFNAIQLFKSSALGKRINSRNYRAANHHLKLHFVSDETSKLPKIEIIDSALPKELELLENYSFSYTEEGILTLDFDVKHGVEVSYSNEDGSNQIQLVMGNGTQTHFTKKYNASHGDDMNFNFIQGLTKSADREAPIVFLMDGDED